MTAETGTPASNLPLFRARLAGRRLIGSGFAVVCAMLTMIGLVVLGVLLVRVFQEGWSLVSWRFLSDFPSRLRPELSGIRSALWGSIWVIGLTGLFSVPLGVGAAIYLQEYARQNRFTRFIHLNIANLAGVPSVVYGILGLAVFTRAITLGHSVLAGALTMTLLVLPVVIIASREALAAVPDSIRQAAYALGATRWQVIRYHVLPAAIPGIMTGIILALSRAMGEAAPLIMIGAAVWMPFTPSSPLDQFTVLPIQIFNWSSEPDPVFHQLAAAAIIVLLVLLLSMNALAIGIRIWQQRR